LKQGAFEVAEYIALFVVSDGGFNGFVTLICADDAEAIAKVKPLAGGQDIELWSGPRLVIRLNAIEKSDVVIH
jgi:hypothetical protein